MAVLETSLDMKSEAYLHNRADMEDMITALDAAAGGCGRRRPGGDGQAEEPGQDADTRADCLGAGS